MCVSRSRQGLQGGRSLRRNNQEPLLRRPLYQNNEGTPVVDETLKEKEHKLPGHSGETGTDHP